MDFSPTHKLLGHGFWELTFKENEQEFEFFCYLLSFILFLSSHHPLVVLQEKALLGTNI